MFRWWWWWICLDGDDGEDGEDDEGIEDEDDDEDEGIESEEKELKGRQDRKIGRQIDKYQTDRPLKTQPKRKKETFILQDIRSKIDKQTDHQIYQPSDRPKISWIDH